MKPVLQALLVADHVYRDVSGKYIVAGTFNHVNYSKRDSMEGASPENPVHVPQNQIQTLGSPWFYLSLTDLKGDVPLLLRYVSLTGDKVFFEMQLTVKSDDPLKTVEIGMPLPALPINAGVHVLELLWNHELLGSHRIVVCEVKNGND